MFSAAKVTQIAVFFHILYTFCIVFLDFLDIKQENLPSHDTGEDRTILWKIEKLPLSFAIGLGGLAFQAREEFAEGRGVGEVEAIGYLGDAQFGCAQQE